MEYTVEYGQDSYSHTALAAADYMNLLVECMEIEFGRVSMLQNLLEHPRWLFLLQVAQSNTSLCLDPIARSSQRATEEVEQWVRLVVEFGKALQNQPYRNEELG